MEWITLYLISVPMTYVAWIKFKLILLEEDITLQDIIVMSSAAIAAPICWIAIIGGGIMYGTDMLFDKLEEKTSGRVIIEIPTGGLADGLIQISDWWDEMKNISIIEHKDNARN